MDNLRAVLALLHQDLSAISFIDASFVLFIGGLAIWLVIWIVDDYTYKQQCKKYAAELKDQLNTQEKHLSLFHLTSDFVKLQAKMEGSFLFKKSPFLLSQKLYASFYQLFFIIFILFIGFYIGLYIVMDMPQDWSVIPGMIFSVAFSFAFFKMIYEKRQREFLLQFPLVLELLENGMRVGKNIEALFGEIGKGDYGWFSKDFLKMYEGLAIGMPMNKMIKAISMRTDSKLFHFFLISLSIQYEKGGPLLPFIEKISEVFRKQIGMQQKVTSITAMQDSSTQILMMMPIVTLFGMSGINPDGLDLLMTHPMGKKMLVGMATYMVVGYAIVKRMMQVRSF